MTLSVILLFILTLGSRSSNVCTGHGVLVVLLVDEDILLVRIDVALLGDVDDIAKGNDVGDQSKRTDEDHHGRIGRYH
jgi:hypothetical protein